MTAVLPLKSMAVLPYSLGSTIARKAGGELKRELYND